MGVLREIEIKKRSERTIHIVIFLFFFLIYFIENIINLFLFQ